jgi:hypothetical protein
MRNLNRCLLIRLATRGWRRRFDYAGGRSCFNRGFAMHAMAIGGTQRTRRRAWRARFTRTRLTFRSATPTAATATTCTSIPIRPTACTPSASGRCSWHRYASGARRTTTFGGRTLRSTKLGKSCILGRLSPEKSQTIFFLEILAGSARRTSLERFLAALHRLHRQACFAFDSRNRLTNDF